MEDRIRHDIRNYRSTAESWGAIALRAITVGDTGAARAAARQASKYARIALELEHGGGWFESETVKRDNGIEKSKSSKD